MPLLTGLCSMSLQLIFAPLNAASSAGCLQRQLLITAGGFNFNLSLNTQKSCEVTSVNCTQHVRVLPHTAALWCNIWKTTKKTQESGDVTWVSKAFYSPWKCNNFLCFNMRILVYFHTVVSSCAVIKNTSSSFNCPPSHRWNDAPLLLLQCWKKIISPQ